uniref:Uncharacterized protein n=1 Tax=Oryza punctata TaxID=4537 RepID=A0A0E0LW71_ORYPU
MTVLTGGGHARYPHNRELGDRSLEAAVPGARSRGVGCRGTTAAREGGRARCRAAELEERRRQAAAESQAWCGLACNNKTVAVGLRAIVPAEGFGDSDPLAAAADAQSYCFETKACHLADDTQVKLDACPVCLASKNASVHITIN